MTSDFAESFSLDGRIAFVTGASGALGGRFAEVLAAAGARVVLAARRVEPMEALRARLAGGPGRHITVRVDVTDPTSIDAAFREADACLGTVDVVVNNSGVTSTVRSLNEADEDWDRILRVNLYGARNVSLTAARRLEGAGKPGAIVNVASVLGLRQGTAVTAYAASKAALIQLTKQYALEWARYGIRVNALAPGYILTNLNRKFFSTDAGEALTKRIPQRRLGSSSELDGALLLLTSSAGSYITGACIPVDGGHLVSSL